MTFDRKQRQIEKALSISKMILWVCGSSIEIIIQRQRCVPNAILPDQGPSEVKIFRAPRVADRSSLKNAECGNIIAEDKNSTTLDLPRRIGISQFPGDGQ
jgi:hypothetical protein